MGPGHFGIAFAAKTTAPKAPLWALLVASEVLDLLSLGFMAASMEKAGISSTSVEQGVQVIVPGSVPWSHGLLMSVVWSVVAAAVAYLAFRDRRAGGAIGLVVFSHWVLDFIVHPSDLPLLFHGSPTVGLGLWTSGPGLIISSILEFVLLGSGIAIYLRWRRSVGRQSDFVSKKAS
jgi:hypothetical protein